MRSRELRGRRGASPRLGRLLVQWAVLACALPGCTTVRDARRAQDAGLTSAGERTTTAAAMGLTAETVLDVDRAVSLALVHHPSVVQARQAVRIAELSLDNARAGRRPGVSASGSVARGTSNRAGGSFSGDTEPAYGAGLSFDVLLLDFGKSSAKIRQAAEALFASELDRRATELDVVHAVRTAFIDLLRSDALLSVAIENRAQLVRQLEQAKTLAEYGRRQPYDVTQATVQVGEASLAVITVSNSVTIARATLNRALGLAEDPGYAVTERTPRRPATDVGALMAVAREDNPELAALGARARAASAGVDAAIADLYPDLTISADAALSGAVFPLAANLSSAARVAAPLWDGHARRNRIEESVAQLRSARARVAGKEQELWQALTVAAAQLVAAEERLVVTEATAKAARENAELSEQRYRLGVGSAIELADAQSAVTSARAAQVQARCDRWLAFADIARLTGETDSVPGKGSEGAMRSVR